MPAASEEPMYCSQQINIPPQLPDILKQFTKAAIRTQPDDALAWSAAYFDALAKGEKPPVKERLDFTLGQAKDKPITQESLSVLHRQLGDRPVVEASKVQQKWHALCLPDDNLKEVMRLGSFGEEFEWLKFLSIACSSLQSDLTLTLKTICEIITKDLEGGPSRIPYTVFKDLYEYLAKLSGPPKAHVDEVVEHLNYEVEKQNGFIGPRNFMSENCPNLNGPPAEEAT